MKTFIRLSALGLMAAATDTPDAGGGSQAAAKKAAKSKVKVKVLVGAVGEDGDTHLKGETFETTAERAAALGDSVELVK